MASFFIHMTFILTNVRTGRLIKKANKLSNNFQKKQVIVANQLAQSNRNSPLSVPPDNVMHIEDSMGFINSTV